MGKPNWMILRRSVFMFVITLFATNAIAELNVLEFSIPPGSHPHDVAPAQDGGVWYTAQHLGALGWFNPNNGDVRQTPLGQGSSPHGVIVGPDGAPWITDSGLNAIVRVSPETNKLRVFAPPPGTPYMNLNTATFDLQGKLWFTGQAGYYGSVDPKSGKVLVFKAPRGRGPYGICTAPDGSVYYASLAGSHITRIDVKTGNATVIEPPTSDQGARRVWADSKGRIWVSEWNAGQLASYDPATKSWHEWLLPGDRPRPYAVYVDDRDMVWISDFGANAILGFDPKTEKFTTIKLPSPGASVRQILGRPGELWLPESGVDKLALIRTVE